MKRNPEDKGSAIGCQSNKQLTRRETILGASSLLGLAALGPWSKIAQAETEAQKARKLVDKLVSPASRLILHDPGPKETSYIIYTASTPLPSAGQFPSTSFPEAAQPSQVVLRIPKKPVVNKRNGKTVYTPVQGMVAVAVDGIIFDPQGPFLRQDPRSGFSFDQVSTVCRGPFAVDSDGGHVRNGNLYHYHKIPHGLVALLRDAGLAIGEGLSVMRLIGWAADGFPVYGPNDPSVNARPLAYSNPMDPASPLIEMTSSYQLVKKYPKNRPKTAPDGTFLEDYEYVAGSGTLDIANGRFGVTPEFPGGIYHYFITKEYPYIPRYFAGFPDESFKEPPPDETTPVPQELRSLFG